MPDYTVLQWIAILGNIGSIIAAVAAAWYWHSSATVSIPALVEPWTSDGPISMKAMSDHVALMTRKLKETSDGMAKQSRLGIKGAECAAIAAFLQLGIFFSTTSFGS